MIDKRINFFWWFLFFLFLFSFSFGVLLRFFFEERIQNRIIEIELNQKQKNKPYYSFFLENEDSSFFKEEGRFLTLKAKYLEEKIKFVEVDLRKMRLSLYENGEKKEEFPVLTKGKEGSWWETPSGSYYVLSKIPNAFSSIGRVWMPYSLQFYGNFFIHGWPYYPDGTPVATSFSGGCIRLANEVAQKVFQFVEIGTPVLVLDEKGKEFLTPPFFANNSESLKPPVISAKAALMVDLDSGFVFLDKNSEIPLPIASLTKLMTAVVASEVINLEKTVNLSNHRFEKRELFVLDKTYTAFDLLYPLLIQSSNDAASLLTSFLGEKRFIEEMNRKAKSLFMETTNFADASGKSEYNVSTARDLAKLAKYILEKRKFIFDITLGKNYQNFGPLNFGSLSNYNEFFNEKNIIGVKNGQTLAAKETLLTVWRFYYFDESQKQKNERRIAVIVLNSEDRKKDTEVILTWLKINFNLLES